MRDSELRERLGRAPILPILTVRSVEAALAQIAALIAGGLTCIEIVFRTHEAKEALRRAKARFPGTAFGAGTMLSVDTFEAATDAKADFLVSPGLTPALHSLAGRSECLFVPGVQTASEVLAAHEFGYRILKYYPSAASNGHVVLADYANIFADIVFIPTGKIEKIQVPLYAALGNVLAVGGSFMIAPDAASTTALAASFLRR